MKLLEVEPDNKKGRRIIMKITKRVISILLIIFLVEAGWSEFTVREVRAIEIDWTNMHIKNNTPGTLGICLLGSGRDLSIVTHLSMTHGIVNQLDFWAMRDYLPNLKTLYIECEIAYETIPANAFCGPLGAHKNLESVTIASTFEYGERYRDLYIGDAAFYGCTNLKEVIIKGDRLSRYTLKGIGNGAFAYSGIKDVGASDWKNAFNHVENIGNDAFKGCDALSYVKLPSISIGSNAFKDCKALNNVNLPNAISIGSNAFEDCKALNNVNLPKTKSIGTYTFKNCDALKSITLPELTTMGWGSFEYCDILETVDFSKVTNVNEYGFYNCPQLKNVNLPMVKTTNWNSFLDCTSLTNIELPNATSIGIDSFKNCTALESTYMPEVNTLEKGAFNNCVNLDTLILGTTIPSIDSYTFYKLPASKNLYVPSASIESYDPDGDSKWEGWTVNPEGTGNTITSFQFKSFNPDSINIDNDKNKVYVTVPYGTPLNSLIPTISVSSNAVISPASGVAQNFSHTINYTVTSQNRHSRTYQIVTTVALNHENKMNSFIFDEFDPDVTGIIDENLKTVSLKVPYGTDITSLVPNISVSAEATVSPESGTVQDFTYPVKYTVTAQNGDIQEYIISVDIADATEKAITAFVIDGLNPDVLGIIDEGSHTVELNVPYGTDVTALAPTITVSQGATVSPTSGTTQDFTSPVTYTVTAQDGSIENYIVNVKEIDMSATLKSLALSEGALTSFDPLVTDYKVKVANSVDKVTVTPTPYDSKASVTVNGENTYEPLNLDTGDNPITVVVTSRDGLSNKTYNIIITREKLIIKDQSLLIGTVGDAYSNILTVEGGTSPYTWSVLVLPDGLSIDAKSGEISGIPKSAGTYNLVITVYDADGYNTSKTLKLVIKPTGKYTIVPDVVSVYTVGDTNDGIITMIVNNDVSGFKFFSVSVNSLKEHPGKEVAVFVLLRDNVQIGFSAVKSDFDKDNIAIIGFNVEASDIIKVYVVDDLTNKVSFNPTILQ